MAKFPNHICGFLDVNEEEFAFNISGQLVTLLPVQTDSNQKNRSVLKLVRNYNELPQYFIGTDDNFFRTAIFRDLNLDTNHYYRSYPSFHFATSLIIRAAGNASGLFDKMSEPWNKYHVINFTGGNINSLYDPAVSIEQPTWEEITASAGRRDIKFRPWEEFTKSIDCEIHGEKCTFTITVTQKDDRTDSEKMWAYNLGERNACIRLEFENPQDFDTFPKYFNIIQKVISILTKQNNVTFNAYLCQKRPDDKLLYPTAVCYTFERYEDFSKRRPDKVIPIETILPYIPEIIKRIAAEFYAPLFELLPDSNKDAKRISITNVQDLCTALEIAYGFGREKREKDTLIEELKKDIKQTIIDFSTKHDIDVYNETTISSSFTYLSLNLKEKVYTLYQENKEIIDQITNKWHVPNLDYEEIAKFVKLRNNKTHSGIIEFGNAGMVYDPLLALVYICYFRELGMPVEMIDSALYNIF